MSDDTEPGADLVLASPELNDRQLAGAHLIAAGTPVAEVAVELGVRPESVSRWRRSPVFQEKVHELIRERYGATLNQAASLIPEALTALDQALHHADWNIRVKAALGLLRLARLPADSLMRAAKPQAGSIHR